MSRAPRQPAELLTEEPFLGWWAVAEGLLTVDELRSSAWRRLLRGVYVHRDVEVDHALRAHAASVLLPRAVASGRSAAALWGVDLARMDDDVEVTLPPGSNPVRVPGVRARRAALPTGHLRQRRGVPLTSPEATAVRLAGLLPGDEAVVAVDRIVHEAGADLALVRALAADSHGRGAARARTACRQADGLAQSPQETRVRLLLHRSELPVPIAQYRVTDEYGHFVALVDFAWPGPRIALEYDGLWHAEPGQFGRDRARLNRLTAAGWRVVFVTAEDLRYPLRLLRRIAAELAR